MLVDGIKRGAEIVHSSGRKHHCREESIVLLVVFRIFELVSFPNKQSTIR